MGQVKTDARRNKGTLRQIADQWGLPRWIIKRVLSPHFPDRTPATSTIPSEQHSQLAGYYEQGMTFVQAWHDLVDNQDSWVPIGSLQRHFRQFDAERGKTQPDLGK
ncbi:hypothetical protein ACFV8E_38965 [Streptomyces sp. NPDC059849]|uniref:hypothetical protein n=1 Tax=Streptomyces sp. NPDC059849 TaxID=3346969 RepID=UPI0036566B02